jgi:formylglycine-generating enzyme required for sulfatase activity
LNVIASSKAITYAKASSWQPPGGFDEYRLTKLLGAGRMGMVYLAHDELLDRHVAVKFITAVDDDALARFLVEARAAARVQHPNVATLFRVGQLDGRPYLIYEFVRGTTLDRLQLPAESGRILLAAIDVARGLAAAHRRGVLHRDIKPGNVILADSGEAKLLDFGIAKLVDESELRTSGATFADESGTWSEDDAALLDDLTQDKLVGTPYFMAPESWLKQATERSDIFSLGLMFYELLSGRGPFRDVPVRELPLALSQRDARPLRAVAPHVPEALAAVIDRCVRRNPQERFASADHLLAALEALRPGAGVVEVPEGNPYRGLRPFEPEHRSLFFGRQRALVAALDRLRVERLLVVTGDSGVGKSSICAAGILPAVAAGSLEDGRACAIARMVPGRAPVEALASALSAVLGGHHDDIERCIRSDSTALLRLVRQRLRDHEGLLIYVDQLEEMVTLAPALGAAQVAEGLTRLVDGRLGVRVLATARADFLSRLEALPAFVARVSRALFLLAPLDPDEVRDAIIGPAAVKETGFESADIVETLVEASVAAQGAMPLLQFTLAELWERRDLQNNLILTSTLDELGGVSGALSRHADALIAALIPAQRAAARSVLLRLVTVEHTRARRLENELVLASPHAKPALEALVRGRLVVASDSAEGPSYEIAHEALLVGWNTLAAWLADESDLRILRHRLEMSVEDWRKRGRPPEMLWNSRQVAETIQIPAEDLSDLHREFLVASERLQQRHRWLRRGTLAAIPVVAISIWLGLGLKQRLERDRAISADLTRFGEFSAAAGKVDADLQVRRRGAFAEFDRGRHVEGETRWRDVVEQRARLEALYRDASERLEHALLQDGTRRDVRAAYGELLFTRAVHAERELQSAERDELLQRMALYDVDQVLQSRWNAAGRVAIASQPPGANVRWRPFVERDHRWEPGEPRELGTTPFAGVTLAPGAGMLEMSVKGRGEVRLPVMVTRGHTLALDVPIIEDRSVPPGMVWVPAGSTYVGSADPELVRSFFKAVPGHPRLVEGFFIARHETTFAAWIEYLDSLSAEERARRAPSVGVQGGTLQLRRLSDGRWQLSMQPGSMLLTAVQGERIVYPGRQRNAAQDWLRMPAVGISYDDALAFASWLSESKRVPGARLCKESEWERAARGADHRSYPHGNALAPTDANFDETYGKDAAGFGPDEVGTHPASRSPFGLDDMAGNVWEWTTSDSPDEPSSARGGSFYYASTTARIANRETPGRDYRDVTLGVRICTSDPRTR